MKTVNVIINLNAGTFVVTGAKEKTAVFFSNPTSAQIKSAKKNNETTITVKGYNVDECTIRNFNLSAIAKGLVIAGLQYDKAKYTAKNDTSVIKSKYTISAGMIEKLFSAQYVTLCDNKGLCGSESLTINIANYDKRNLRALVKVGNNKPLYKAVVIDGIDINSDQARNMIIDWVNSIIVFTQYVKAVKDIKVSFDIDNTKENNTKENNTKENNTKENNTK